MNWTEKEVREHEQRKAITKAFMPSPPYPKLPKPVMNKWEMEYATILENRKRVKDIIDWRFEPLKLRLADATFYTPDFLVVVADGFEFHEVKGFWRDDALVKFKVAAELFPFFRFLAMRKASVREGGHWVTIKDSYVRT